LLINIINVDRVEKENNKCQNNNNNNHVSIDNNTNNNDNNFVDKNNKDKCYKTQCAIKDSQITNYLPNFTARKCKENSSINISSLRYPSWAKSKMLSPIYSNIAAIPVTQTPATPKITEVIKSQEITNMTPESPKIIKAEVIKSQRSNNIIIDSTVAAITEPQTVKQTPAEPHTVKSEKYSNWNKGHTQISSFKQESNKFNHILVPPIVRLTSKSVETGDNVYALSRFRDHRIYNNVRMFLSYFHDQSDICYEGMTQTSLKVLIHQEGLPNNPSELSKLYFLYHETTGLNKNDVLKDLAYYRRHIDNKYREYLQRTRETWQNYMISKP